MNRQQTIRKAYKDCLPHILENYPHFDPYILDWAVMMSPIERNVWHDIRVNRIPMLPQFPVRGYFLDFADPVRKIGLEVDGKKWHRDKEADLKRQREIEDDGWDVYRIEGKYTYLDQDDLDEEEGELHYNEYTEKYEPKEEYSSEILRKIGKLYRGEE